MLASGQYYPRRILQMIFFFLTPQDLVFLWKFLFATSRLHTWGRQGRGDKLNVWSYYRNSRISFVLGGEVLRRCNYLTQHVRFARQEAWVSKRPLFLNVVSFQNAPRRVVWWESKRRTFPHPHPPKKNHTHTPALGCWVIRDHSCFSVNPLLHLCFSSNDLQSHRGRDSFFNVNIKTWRKPESNGGESL